MCPGFLQIKHFPSCFNRVYLAVNSLFYPAKNNLPPVSFAFPVLFNTKALFVVALSFWNLLVLFSAILMSASSLSAFIQAWASFFSSVLLTIIMALFILGFNFYFNSTTVIDSV